MFTVESVGKSYQGKMVEIVYIMREIADDMLLEIEDALKAHGIAPERAMNRYGVRMLKVSRDDGKALDIYTSEYFEDEWAYHVGDDEVVGFGVKSIVSHVLAFVSHHPSFKC